MLSLGLIEQCLLRTVAFVTVTVLAQVGIRASLALQHDHFLAIGGS
jgi:hypothetical protein